MNDRFKFRVFSKTDEKVYPVWAITPLNIVLNTLGRENINIPRTQGILMQSTGLKDKNGKLIFEGDILQENWHKYILEWANGAYTIKDIKRGTSYMFTSGICIHKSEVIGNIYENKELLEGENGL
ncbi:MAG: hypothetical protein IKW45_03740 [Clostridia bacterium]|nr:hypothetical protein [Clostridia bacterium]